MYIYVVITTKVSYVYRNGCNITTPDQITIYLIFNSDLCVNNNLDKFLKTLGLIEDNTDDEFETNDDTNNDNKFWMINDDIEDDD